MWYSNFLQQSLIKKNYGLTNLKNFTEMRIEFKPFVGPKNYSFKFKIANNVNDEIYN